VNVAGDLFKHHLVATLAVVAVMLGLPLLWVLRKRYKKSGNEVDERDTDESEPHRRKRRWL
jgi:hypothetical protein